MRMRHCAPLELLFLPRPLGVQQNAHIWTFEGSGASSFHPYERTSRHEAVQQMSELVIVKMAIDIFIFNTVIPF